MDENSSKLWTKLLKNEKPAKPRSVYLYLSNSEVILLEVRNVSWPGDWRRALYAPDIAERRTLRIARNHLTIEAK